MLIVDKVRQPLEEGREHVLRKVGGIVVLQAAAPRPEEQKRRIKLNEPAPGLLIRRLADALE